MNEDDDDLQDYLKMK